MNSDVRLLRSCHKWQSKALLARLERGKAHKNFRELGGADFKNYEETEARLQKFYINCNGA